MKQSKDLNWLSAPAFFLIIGMIAFHTKNQNTHNRLQEKVKPPIAALTVTHKA
jgi:hypothetical protein